MIAESQTLKDYKPDKQQKDKTKRAVREHEHSTLMDGEVRWDIKNC